MAAQDRSRDPEQPSNENTSSFKTLTVNSSWLEILEEINKLQREIAELKEGSR